MVLRSFSRHPLLCRLPLVYECRQYFAACSSIDPF
jgi:hypothetical protein